MSLEVGTSGPLVDRAITTCLNNGGAQPLVAVLEKAPEQQGVAADRLRARLTQPMAIGAIASREPLDEASLDYLMPALSIEGYGTLLDVLASSRSRVTRRKLLERLATTPLDAVALVAARLADDRWYVQRNMLLLLARMGRVPDGFPLARWTTHTDERLRSEALRLQMALPGQREIALRAAFSDADPRVVRVGVGAVQQGCPLRVLPFLAGLAAGERVPEDLRLLAVQALGNTRDEAALDSLFAVASGGKTLLGRQKLAPKNTVVLAALRALAASWRKHPKVEPLLGLAAVSTDDDFREAVR
jgi:HEAT repeat protein